VDHHPDAEAKGEAPKSRITTGLVLTVPFLGVQFPVGYWPEETYPYFWPGEIHKALEVEKHWSSWNDTANYARFGNVWLSVPRP
jgi:hypothetical protein